MRKIIFTICLLVCAMCMYGQGNIRMKGVDHLDKALLESIIKKYSPSKSRASEERPMIVKAINAIHKDMDSGKEIEKGRVLIEKKRLSDGTTSTGKPTLTPYYTTQSESGYQVINITESKPPASYNAHTTRLVIYFDEDQNITDILANEDIMSDRLYFTVIFLCDKIS